MTPQSAKALRVGAIVVALMLFVPPWEYRVDYRGRNRAVAGPYYPVFLGKPEVPVDTIGLTGELFQGTGRRYWVAKVDASRLLLQLAGAVAVIWAIFARFERRGEASAR